MSETTHKIITVNYNLFRDTAEGEMIETTEGKQPLVFMTGMGHMIPDFEANVVNLNNGDEFSFGIKADNAYGQRTQEAVIELPQDIFMKDGKLLEEVVVGNVLPLQDQTGRVIPGMVLAINEKSITVDVNHPLAGQDLHFTGAVVEVRPATAEEIEQAQNPGPAAQ